MPLKLFTPPAAEPVTLAEAKSHLKLESQSFEDSIGIGQSILPGVHQIGTNKGIGIDISAAGDVVAVLQAGACSEGGSIAARIQDSDIDEDSRYQDSGSFDVVTQANQSSVYKMKYSGSRRYVRGIAIVAGDTCEFGLSVLMNSPVDPEDASILRMIKAARKDCERYQGRVYVTQTWDLYLDQFPGKRWIEIPMPPLQSIEFIRYKDSAGNIQTLDEGCYEVDAIGEPGRVSLAWSQSWPLTYDGSNAVQIRFIAGYGDPADVPDEIKQAILMIVTDLYEHRGDENIGSAAKDRADSLLSKERLVTV